MPYQPTADFATALKLAEGLGRAYAASVGKPWPMPPDAYGPGRQPQPPTAFFQRYWQAPLDASGPSVLDPNAKQLPPRVEVDAVALTFSNQKIPVTDGSKVTLDFTGLVSDAAASPAQLIPADTEVSVKP